MISGENSNHDPPAENVLEEFSQSAGLSKRGRIRERRKISVKNFEEDLYRRSSISGEISEEEEIRCASTDSPRLEISKLNKSRGSSWRDRVVPIDLYEGCRIEWKIGTREINLEENCSCREEGRGRKELGSGSRSERSDDTMLSIWTASTLSIACGEPFKFKPSMRRCLSCSSLVDGKLWCKSNLDYTEQLSQQSFNPCRNDFREHPILNLICKRKEKNWNVIATKMIEISLLPIIFNDYLFYQNCIICYCIMCYENINNPFGWLIRKKEVLEVLLGIIWRWLRISTLIFTMIVLIWL